MALLVARDGDGWQPCLRCDLCGQPFLVAHSWVGTAPLSADVDMREGVLAHRACLDGAAERVFGVPRVMHWRDADFFARLLQAATGIMNPTLPQLTDRRWQHRP
jgi:hypothetical protein